MAELGKKNNINTEFSEAALKEAKKRGGIKTLGDAIGLPDDQDKDFIRRLIIKYERKHPGWIQKFRDEARSHHQAKGGRTAEWGETNKAAHGRLLFELPEQLYFNIEQAYPLMFRDKKHFKWFAKHFKELMIPTKY